MVFKMAGGKKRGREFTGAEECVEGESECSPAKKRKQKRLEKLVSLLEENDSLSCAASEENGAVEGELVSKYLAQCERLTQPLEWEREKRTLDVVRWMVRPDLIVSWV